MPHSISVIAYHLIRRKKLGENYFGEHNAKALAPALIPSPANALAANLFLFPANALAATPTPSAS
jgi:hypothetical protein